MSLYCTMNLVMGLFPSKPAMKLTSTARFDCSFSVTPVMLGGYGSSERQVTLYHFLLNAPLKFMLRTPVLSFRVRFTFAQLHKTSKWSSERQMQTQALTYDLDVSVGSVIAGLRVDAAAVVADVLVAHRDDLQRPVRLRRPPLVRRRDAHVVLEPEPRDHDGRVVRHAALDFHPRALYDARILRRLRDPCPNCKRTVPQSRRARTQAPSKSDRKSCVARHQMLWQKIQTATRSRKNEIICFCTAYRKRPNNIVRGRH